MSGLFLIKLTAKAILWISIFLSGKFPRKEGFRAFSITFTVFVEIVGAM